MIIIPRLALIFLVSIANPLVGKGPKVNICIPAEAKPVTKAVEFKRRLVDSSPDQLRKAGKELMEEVGVLDVNKLKIFCNRVITGSLGLRNFTHFLCRRILKTIYSHHHLNN